MDTTPVRPKSTISFSKSFFIEKGKLVHELFTNEKRGVGPKDQAKQCILGEALPKYFLHASSYRSGAKYFMVDSFVPWVEQYFARHWTRREEYEVLTDVFPLKLFFDLEFDPRAHPDVCMDRCINVLHNGIRAGLRRTFAFHDVVRLDANIDSKTSTHLVYPTVVFRSMRHMQFFLHTILLPSLPRAMFELLQGGDDVGSVIDLSVYSKDRLFRMYGSNKGTKRNPLLPPGAAPGDPLDLQVLRASLVSIPPLDNVIAYDLHERPQYVREHNDQYLQFVCNELRKTYPRRTIRGSGTRGTYVNVQLVPGVVCGVVHRQHKGNTTYFTVDVRTGHGWFQCTDPDCRATRCKGKFGVGPYPNYKLQGL